MLTKVTKGYIKYKKPSRENSKGKYLWCVSYRQEGKVKRAEMYLNSGYFIDLDVIAFKVWNKDINKEAFIDAFISYTLRKDYSDTDIKKIIIDKDNYPEIKLLSQLVDTFYFDCIEKDLKRDFEDFEIKLKELEADIDKTLKNLVDYINSEKIREKALKDNNFNVFTRTDLLMEVSTFKDNKLKIFNDSQKIEILKYLQSKISKKFKLNNYEFLELMGITSNNPLWGKLIKK
jgi:hypothetical protein